MSVKSLARQTYADIEHVVQDACSTDRSIDIIRKISPDSLIVSEADDGLYHALNKGMSRATGNILGILHVDDYFLSDEIVEKIVHVFQQTDCDAMYGDLKYVDRSDTSKAIRTWRSGEYSYGDFIKGWMPPHPTLFIKKDVIEKYGGYNLDLGTAADYEWMLRLIHKNKIKLAYLPEFIVAMRTGGQSNISIRSRIKANLMDRKAWKVNGLKPKWYTLWLKPIQKVTQYF